MSPKVCNGCGAVGVSCCVAAQARRETGNALAGIVARQSAAVTRLTRERDEALQVLKGLRVKAAA